jgi:hypothetical protein
MGNGKQQILSYAHQYILALKECWYAIVFTQLALLKRMQNEVMDSEGRVVKIMSFDILQSCNENQPNVPRMFGALVECDNLSAIPNINQLLRITHIGNLISIHPANIIS